MKPPISVQEFRKIIMDICYHDTAYANGNGWSADNPLWGHCAIVSLWIQNLYSGSLLKVSLEATEFAEVGSHYFNYLPDGTIIDATVDQFRGRLPKNLEPVEVLRKHLMSNEDTKMRYSRFGWRLIKELYAKNNLISDPIFERCVKQALQSSCKKRGVGSVFAYGTTPILQACNNPLEPVAQICDPECIRYKISSGTNCLVSGCTHAEENVLWRAIHDGYRPLTEYSIYVAGLNELSLPWFEDKPAHKCLRCSMSMHLAKLRAVYIPMGDSWKKLTTKKCLQTAMKHAVSENSLFFS